MRRRVPAYLVVMRIFLAVVCGFVAGWAAFGIAHRDVAFAAAEHCHRVGPALIALLVLGIAIHLLLYYRRGLAALAHSARLQVLVVLPVWGFFINGSLSGCEDRCGEYRPLAVPQIYGVFAAHGLAVLAYAVARRRPEWLRPWLELSAHALLLLGLVVDVAVAIQFGPLYGLFRFDPIDALPLLAPSLSALLFAVELYRRLRRRGREALGPAHPLTSLPALLLASPVAMGLYALVHALVLRSPRGAAQAFTEVCAGTFATLQPPVGGCHYLCTVAAQGHPWLVRPQRLGRRRGVTIVVNRQLAVANAFEDLLHERWPRFGAWARRTYDRCAYPLSRHLGRRWMADAVYLLMKPAEWAFYAVLLLLDRRPPEERIDRMYR
jgi:hypothetical protein